MAPPAGQDDVDEVDAVENRISTFDTILTNNIKPIGRWQWLVFSLLIFPISSPATIFSTFPNLVPPHRCRLPVLDNNNNSRTAYDFISHNYIPKKTNPDLPPMVGQIYHPCQRYRYQWWYNASYDNSVSLQTADFNTTPTAELDSLALNTVDNVSTEVCKDGYVYDTTEYHYRGTVIEEFDLVCDRAYLAPLETSLFMLSSLFSCLTSGYFADKYGRKVIIVTASLLQLISGYLIPFSVNIYMYMCFRAMNAFALLALVNSGFVLMSEITNCDYRNVFMVLFSVNCGVCGLIYAFLAYLMLNWRYLHALIMLMLLPSLLFPWLLPESPRWLLAVGRTREALVVIRKAIAMNNREPLTEEDEQSLRDFIESEDAKEEIPSGVKNPSRARPASVVTILVTQLASYVRVFRAPTVRRRTLLTMHVWLQQGMVFYGSIFYSASLEGNRYLTFAALCFMSIPSNLFFGTLYHKFSRKTPLLVCMLLIVPIFVGIFFYQLFRLKQSPELPVIIGAIASRFINDATFTMVYVLTPELYPTDVRNYGLCMCSSFARIGAALSPFVVRLSQTTWRPLPALIFAICTAVSSVLIVFLPETKNRRMPESVEGLENWNFQTSDQAA